MTKSLYGLTDEAIKLETKIRSAAEQLFSDDPAEVEAARAELEALLSDEADTREALARKADAWCWVIDRARATAAERKAHAKRLQELAAADEAKADRLQDQLVALLLRTEPDATSFELPDHKISSRKSEAVTLDPDLQAESLPADLRRVKYEANKTAIKERIQAAIKEAVKGKEGDEAIKAAAIAAASTIPGAQLVTRRSWRIG